MLFCENLARKIVLQLNIAIMWTKKCNITYSTVPEKKQCNTYWNIQKVLQYCHVNNPGMFILE